MAVIPLVDMMCTSLLDTTLPRQPKRLSLMTDVNPVNLQDMTINWIMDKDILNLMADRSRAETENPHSQRKKEDFQVMLDVQHFKPEEIEVKVDKDNYLVVAAKHEDRQDHHGWVSRQFVRRYRLPEGIDVEQLTSKLSSDGLLTIVAPKKQPLKDETQRTLRIECTGKPFMNKKQEKPKTFEQSENQMEME